jgi:potassium channel subfamily K
LLAINGISLAFAIVANSALLLNMARRVRFAIGQSFTIIGFYMASLLLMSIIIVSSTKLKLEGYQMSSGFYYAIMACVLYFWIATLMLMTVYGAWRGHYSSEFHLTMSQRTLMLQTMSYVAYLLSGAAVFSHIEGWAFLDGVYWANTTLLTIGLGDFSPSTHLGRGLLLPYAVGGIVFLGLVIGSIRSLVLAKGEKKMSSRMIEAQRVRILTGLKENKSVLPKAAKKIQDAISHAKTERARRKAEFQLMRVIQDRAASTKRWTSLMISATGWFTLWFIGAVVFWISEDVQGWSYFQAVYFCYTSLLTIG